jgi:hypothetical protein
VRGRQRVRVIVVTDDDETMTVPEWRMARKWGYHSLDKR